jgi:hypothetical protein
VAGATGGGDGSRTPHDVLRTVVPDANDLPNGYPRCRVSERPERSVPTPAVGA